MGIKNNVGTLDRILRLIIAAVFVYLGYIYNYWFYLGAAILVFTAITGFCGLYHIFGLSTCKVKAPMRPKDPIPEGPIKKKTVKKKTAKKKTVKKKAKKKSKKKKSKRRR